MSLRCKCDKSVMLKQRNVVSISKSSSDPGAVSRAGRKDTTKGSKHGHSSLVFENFRHAFSPGPTNCPWVSEDGKTFDGRLGWKRIGTEKRGTMGQNFRFYRRKKNNKTKQNLKKKVNLRKSTYKNISLNKMTVCTVTTPFSSDMFVVPS